MIRWQRGRQLTQQDLHRMHQQCCRSILRKWRGAFEAENGRDWDGEGAGTGPGHRRLLVYPRPGPCPVARDLSRPNREWPRTCQPRNHILYSCPSFGSDPVRGLDHVRVLAPDRSHSLLVGDHDLSSNVSRHHLLLHATGQWYDHGLARLLLLLLHHSDW